MFARQLLDCLEREQQQLSILLDVLQKEAQALLQRAQPPELAQLAQEKLQCFQTLHELGAERDALLQQEGLATGHEGTEAAIEKYGYPELAAAWQALLSTAESARQQNEHNGLYIRTQLKFTTESMKALHEAQSRNALYGPRGRQLSAQPNLPTRTHRA